MSTSLYDLSVPVFLRAFQGLTQVLDKAEAWAKENGVDPATLTEGRLAPDMRPLTAQIQMASDSAKGVIARLTGKATPFEDNEVSFADLKARIARTVEVLENADRAAIDGQEEAEVVLTFPGASFAFTGRNYVLGFAIPNFFFHVTTAYAILRHLGAPLGKQDFLAGVASAVKAA